MAAKRRGLGGRDLDALLGGSRRGTESDDHGDDAQGDLRNLPLDAIQAGSYQPRRHWDETALDELAASIRAQGLIQPVVVRPIGKGRYELIAGERRWRACRLAGLQELPALVKEVSDEAAPAMALIENIQRQDLSPLEEAQALKRLLEDFSLTHQQVAEAVGRSRAAVSNLLRLLELPEEIASLLDDGKLGMGHARALLTLPRPMAIRLARQSVDQEWSVRQLERAVQTAQQTGGGDKPKTTPRNPDLAALERELSDSIGSAVRVTPGRGKGGKLVIAYHDADQLEGILDRLRSE